MIVNKVGKYRLLQDYISRVSFSTGTFRKGTVIEITRIDQARHKIFGPILGDWQYWVLPVEPVELPEAKKEREAKEKETARQKRISELRAEMARLEKVGVIYK